MLNALIRRIARRCDTHDRASYAVTSRLERQLGMKPTAAPDSFVDAHCDPTIIDCGHTWCAHRR